MVKKFGQTLRVKTSQTGAASTNFSKQKSKAKFSGLQSISKKK